MPRENRSLWLVTACKTHLSARSPIARTLIMMLFGCPLHTRATAVGGGLLTVAAAAHARLAESYAPCSVHTLLAIAARPHSSTRHERAPETRHDTTVAAGRHTPTDPPPQSRRGHDMMPFPLPANFDARNDAFQGRTLGSVSWVVRPLHFSLGSAHACFVVGASAHPSKPAARGGPHVRRQRHKTT